LSVRQSLRNGLDSRKLAGLECSTQGGKLSFANPCVGRITYLGARPCIRTGHGGKREGSRWHGTTTHHRKYQNSPDEQETTMTQTSCTHAPPSQLNLHSAYPLGHGAFSRPQESHGCPVSAPAMGNPRQGYMILRTLPPNQAPQPTACHPSSQQSLEILPRSLLQLIHIAAIPRGSHRDVHLCRIPSRNVGPLPRNHPSCHCKQAFGWRFICGRKATGYRDTECDPLTRSGLARLECVFCRSVLASMRMDAWNGASWR
jgi:hypothetical protein